jgi:hypothetical protein
VSEVCDGLGRLYCGPSVGAGEGGGGGAGDLEVVGRVDVFAVIAVVFILWLNCAPCDCLCDLGVGEGGLAEGAACVVGGISGVEPLDVVGFVTSWVDFK